MITTMKGGELIKMKMKLFLPVTALVLTGGLLIANFNRVSAETSDTNSNPFSSLAKQIAETFNLNQAEVETVFTEHRNQRRAQMENGFTERLTQAVSEGKITEAQKQLILEKRQEFMTQREVGQPLTEAERTAHHEEMEAWAQQNGIDMDYVMMGGRGNGRGMRGMK